MRTTTAITQIVSRRRREMRPSRRLPSCDGIIRFVHDPESVSGALDRVDQRAVEPAVDLLAQRRDVHVDDVAGGFEVHVPDLLADLDAAEHAVLVAHEALEKRELAVGKLDLLAGAGGDVRVEIEFEIVAAQNARLGRLAAAHEGAQPGEKLLELEWLGQVVVSAGIQAVDLVLDRKSVV